MRAAKYMSSETAYVPVIDLARILRSLHGNSLALLNDRTVAHLRGYEHQLRKPARRAAARSQNSNRPRVDMH